MKTKWQEEQTQLAKGYLAFEIEAEQPSGNLKLTIVEQVHPSDNTMVYKVNLHNSVVLYTMPIVNLIPLKQKFI
jgi:hypothetical protein